MEYVELMMKNTAWNFKHVFSIQFLILKDSELKTTRNDGIAIICCHNKKYILTHSPNLPLPNKHKKKEQLNNYPFFLLTFQLRIKLIPFFLKPRFVFFHFSSVAVAIAVAIAVTFVSVRIV